MRKDASTPLCRVPIIIIQAWFHILNSFFLTRLHHPSWQTTGTGTGSVADPGCLSRILIFTHPGSRIQKQLQKRGVKKNWCYTFLCSHKFHKIVHYFSFEVLKKNLGQFSKNYRTFYPKNCHKALKSMGLGSEIRDPEKTYSGSRIQVSKRHRIPDPDPQHWLAGRWNVWILMVKNEKS